MHPLYTMPMSHFSRKELLRVSRPRFWIYLFGPYLLGLTAAPTHRGDISLLFAAILFFYFLFPANLLLYGVNDAYDYETDKLNPKKQGYEGLITPEKKWPLLKIIALVTLPFLLLVFILPLQASLLLELFLLLSVSYSVPPLRLKTRPVIDAISNGLYLVPGLISYSLLTSSLPPLRIIIAAWLWCMAMHAYSAAPDMIADIRSKTPTIATVFGKHLTLLFCLMCYASSTILLFPFAPFTAVILGVVYVAMMVISLKQKNSTDLLPIYRFFPLINTACGFILYLTLIAHKLVR